MVSGIGNRIRDVGDAAARPEKSAERTRIDHDPENRHVKPIQNVAADRRDRRNVFAGRHAILVARLQSEVHHETTLRAEAAGGPTKDGVWLSGGLWMQTTDARSEKDHRSDTKFRHLHHIATRITVCGLDGR